MTPLQSFNLIDRIKNSIAILDEHGRENEEATSYMLWLTDWKALRQNLLLALDTAKHIEIND